MCLPALHSYVPVFLQFVVYNVTYTEPRLSFPINILRSGVYYRARVRVLAQSISGTWSEWSPSITWYNGEYQDLGL